MEKYNVEAAVEKQETSQNYGSQEAMAKAKENIAERKLRQETEEIERRLRNAESKEEDALKALRMARVREAANKQYLTDFNKAKTAFETSGDYNAYDEAVREAERNRDKAVTEGKQKIYGDDAWRY